MTPRSGAGSGVDPVSSRNGAGSGVDSVSSWTGAGSGVDSVSSWTGAGSVRVGSAADGGGLDFPRMNGGVIESRHRGEPAELPGILNEWEILVVKGNEAGSDFNRRREKTGTTKKLFKNGKQSRGGKALLTFCFLLSVVLSHCSVGMKRRRR